MSTVEEFSNKELINELERRLKKSTDDRIRYMVTVSLCTEEDGNAHYLKRFKRLQEAKDYFQNIKPFSREREWLVSSATNDLCTAELLEQIFSFSDDENEAKCSSLKVLDKKHFHRVIGEVEIENGHMFKDGKAVVMIDGMVTYIQNVKQTK